MRSVRRLPEPLIWLTRPEGENERLAELLAASGLATASVPCVRLGPLDDPRPLRDAVLVLGADDVLVLTSQAGARAVAAAIGKRRCAAGIAAIGIATADACRALGLQVTFTASRPTGAALGAELPVPVGWVLLARADRAGEELPLRLRARGATVGEIVAYRTEPVAPRRALDADVVVFASPSAVDGFASGAALGDARAVAIGPTTAARVRERLGTEPVVAAQPDERALAAAVRAALEERHVTARR